MVIRVVVMQINLLEGMLQVEHDWHNTDLSACEIAYIAGLDMYSVSCLYTDVRYLVL